MQESSMTAAATTADPKSKPIPWWKAYRTTLIVLVAVAAGFVLLRPRGSHAREKAYAAMNRPGVQLTFKGDDLESAKFALSPGLESQNSNLGWAFQQLMRFPEVKSVETGWFINVNLPTLRALSNLES